MKMSTEHFQTTGAIPINKNGDGPEDEGFYSEIEFWVK